MMRSEFFLKNMMVFFLSIILVSFFGCSEEDQNITPVQSTQDSATSADATLAPAACSTCTFVVPANMATIDGKVLGFKPGDVICFSAANKYTTTITFKNIIGTADKPITITNCGGVVNLTVSNRPWNFKTSNSKYFRITGGNVNGAYGLRISGSTSNGLVLCELSNNFEVDHIEVFNVGFAGIMAKTDPTCDDATIRGNFTMRDVSFHDNYVHDTGGEGFYIGHTYYAGYKTSCGVRLPHLIENAKIYNNLVKNSGWDGIQLSCANKGAELYGNTVQNYATKNTANQNTGITLGAGTGGSCYGNFINGGHGNGIAAFGLADNLIHDNIIVNAGQMGIFCDERTDPGTGFKIINNTIVNPKTEGMRIYAELVPMNYVINNIIVNPGSYGSYGDGSYIMKLKSAPLTSYNNITTRNITDLKFVNAGAQNYRLGSGSPAIDKGYNINSYQIAKDFYNALRLKGTAYDVGASEY
jgi:hypothetical protein